ncbi:hypothetical protein AAFF_G00211450 [Aldrovandia affinis]|uniref:Myosin X N-terminal SH3 domain-containing protein n=1 Tax=Aldrovandia affinis TaxID=143900 RepID=A0AAD7SWI2_9TELE|nr:hypothetical protein AAFF_G00211450 [Aldrovandia affinis]
MSGARVWVKDREQLHPSTVSTCTDGSLVLTTDYGQVTELGQEKDKLQQELEETRKTADKRQAMLDELAIDVAQEKSRHKEELSDARLQHEKEVLGGRARYEKELRGLHEDKNRAEEEIRSQLRNEKARTRELESLQPTVEKLQAQIQSMEGTKGWFERRLKEADETAEKSALEHQEQVQKLQLEQTAQLQGKMAEMEAQQRATENAFREVLKVQAETVLDLQARLKGTLPRQHRNVWRGGTFGAELADAVKQNGDRRTLTETSSSAKRSLPLRRLGTFTSSGCGLCPRDGDLPQSAPRLSGEN